MHDSAPAAAGTAPAAAADRSAPRPLARTGQDAAAEPELSGRRFSWPCRLGWHPSWFLDCAQCCGSRRCKRCLAWAEPARGARVEACRHYLREHGPHVALACRPGQATTGRAQEAACAQSTCRNYGQPVPGKFAATGSCHSTHSVVKCRCGTDFVRCSAVIHD